MLHFYYVLLYVFLFLQFYRDNIMKLLNFSSCYVYENSYYFIKKKRKRKDEFFNWADDSVLLENWKNMPKKGQALQSNKLFLLLLRINNEIVIAIVNYLIVYVTSLINHQMNYNALLH